ncbi:MAG: mechanosensitive ion channel family protein [Anaerolineales bacterium]|jgi:small-conductance mechanosensitive channel
MKLEQIKSMGFFPLGFLIGAVILVLLAGCGDFRVTQTPEANLTPTWTPTSSPTPPSSDEIAGAENETPQATPTQVLSEFVAPRAPEPTATPGPIALIVEEYTAQVGLAETKFLGISVTDWINLGLSAILVLIGYLVGTWFIRRLLPRLVSRTAEPIDDQLLQAIGSDIRWLVTLLLLNFATERLTFVSASIKTVLTDAYFILTLFFVLRVSWKLINLLSERAVENYARQGREGVAPLIKMLDRISRIVLVIVGLTIILSHFGVNVTAFAAALGIGGLAISLAAKDTVADAIAGVIILVDQPFRVGDRIEIQEVGTWGDVTDIGLRTTRIRTRDNRMVIVPNSIISNNQVINYTFPDPRYRIETYVYIAFGTDIERVRGLLIDTISHVEGVLTDKPVDALYDDMGGDAMRFRVRWWIKSYVDTRRMFDRVHTAIQHALDDAGIVSPHIAENIKLYVPQETSDRLSRAIRPSELDRRRDRADDSTDDKERDQ